MTVLLEDSMVPLVLGVLVRRLGGRVECCRAELEDVEGVLTAEFDPFGPLVLKIEEGRWLS